LGERLIDNSGDIFSDFYSTNSGELVFGKFPTAQGPYCLSPASDPTDPPDRTLPVARHIADVGGTVPVS
jgi:hypothetical protein